MSDTWTGVPNYAGYGQMRRTHVAPPIDPAANPDISYLYPGGSDTPASNGYQQTTVTGLPNSSGVGQDQGSRDALQRIKDSLKNWNFTSGQVDSLSTFAWSELVNGRAESEIMQDLWQRQEFKDRFPAIFERSQNGQPPISPSEYVALEGQYAQLVKQAGLPPGVFDKPEMYHSWIAKNRSPQEIKELLQQGWQMVAQSPPSVRAAFSAFYGPDQGDAWLASLFLDDKETLPILEQHARAAQFAGVASGFGLDVGRGTAEHIAELGLPDYQQRQILGDAQQLRPLTIETATGETTDLTGDQAVAAKAGIDPSLYDLFQRRQQNRLAAFAGGGGAMLTRQGLAGVGAAETNQ